MAKLKFPVAGPSVPWRDGPLILEDLGTFLTGDDIEVTVSNNASMVPVTFQAVFNLSNYQSLTHCNITIIGDRIFLTLNENSPTKEWAGAGPVYIRIKVKNKTTDAAIQFGSHIYDLSRQSEFGGFPFFIKGHWHNDAAEYLEQLFSAYGMTTSVTDVESGRSVVKALDLTGLRYLLETVTSVPFVNLGLPVTLDSVGMWSKNIAIGSFKSPGHWKELLKYCQSYAAITKTITNKEPVLSFIPASGLYADGLQIIMQMNKPGRIYYTVDGSFPTTNSQRYSAPIVLSDNLILRAIGISDEGFYSNIVRESYTVVRPSTLTYSVMGDTVTLNWQSVIGAVNYNIYDGHGSKLNASPITGLSWAETVPISVGEKSYYMRVVDIQGRESLPSNTVNVSFAPAPPTNVQSTLVTSTAITLTWDAIGDPPSYEVEYAGETKTVNEKTIVIENLLPNKEYTFTIYSKRGSKRSLTPAVYKETTAAATPGINVTKL